jgi:hypothetical protein
VRQHTHCGAEFGDRPRAVGEQRDGEHHQQRGVEQRIDRRAGVTLGQGYPVGPRGQANRLGPQPVQDRTHRREEAVVQRPEATSEADDLEEHGVEHDLLEHDRLGVPVRHIREPVDARRGQDDQPRGEDVEQDLDDIEKVQDARRPEADLGPVAGHRHDPFGAGAFAPLLVIDDGRVLFEKTHERKTRTCSSRADSVRRLPPPT